ncbi:recombinase RecT [Desulfovirgula thermocuniculi]|uniref:recombinase RecT n=1 Tax=Desulfovirgula thermocuniculi TaxID=348842 RepID=UPI000404949B|nr:recombinase RecT [Desulfovirgula thermocuniculi]
MALDRLQDLGAVPAPARVTASAGELARRKIYAGIPDDDVALALAICQKYGLDPLLRHVVLIAKNAKDEVTGQWTKRYDAYITRDGLLHIAHSTGLLDGIEVTLGKDELGEWAECAVYRKDMSRPFRYRVYMNEYAQEPRGAWKTHPRAMLTKTAEVFALRRAFDVALTPVEEMGIDEDSGQGELAGLRQACRGEIDLLGGTAADVPEASAVREEGAGEGRRKGGEGVALPGGAGGAPGAARKRLL